MRLTLDINGKRFEAEMPWERAKAVIDELKRWGARFNPATKTWNIGQMPCSIASVFAVSDCVEGKFWKSFFYYTPISKEELERNFCFTVSKWKTVSCEEYCEERCEEAYDPERCIDRCVDRCEEEGWSPKMRVEDKVCLYKLEGNVVRIPRGLALRVAKRVKYAELPALSDFGGLRSYQAEVAKSVWDQLGRIGTATVQMATGAGKSYLAGFLAKRLEEAGYRVFVVALQLDLVYQLREFASRFGASPIAVTIQTLWRRLQKAGVVKESGDAVINGDDEESGVLRAYADESPAPDDLAELYTQGKVAVILDEVHHLPARTVKTVAMAAGDGWGLRIGLSATPWRNDGRDLEIYAYMGDVVEPRISSSFLIERGYAVPVEIHMIQVGDWGCTDGDYAEVRRCLAENEKRNKLIAELVETAPKPALVLTPLVKHAETLASAIAGAELVTGAVKGETRQEIFDRVRRGYVDVLVATTIADEGLDIPVLRSAIIALGGRSKTRVLQRIGRLVRPYPGKDKAIAYDLWDSAPYFNRQGKERYALYKTEPAWRVEIRTED